MSICAVSPKRLALCIASALVSSVSVAEAIPGDAAFETITISATRSERDINEITSHVSVIDSEQIDAQVMTDIRDLVRYEPGVSVEGGGRFGLAGFNIRGINGDRVLMLLDGVPIADEFSFGPALSARRDFVDIDMLQQAEIIRGPASTLYGSDAIGGVVAFISKDPKHLVAEGERFGGRLKTGYVSASDEWWVTGQLAGYAGDWQWLLSGTERQGHEIESFYTKGPETGSERVAADPQESTSTSGQIKLIYTPSEHHRLMLIADMLNGSTQTDVQSSVDTLVRGVLITESLGDDERERSRIQLNYEYDNEHTLFDKFLLRGFMQETDTLQNTKEERFGAVSRTDPTPIALDRTRSSRFEQRIRGGILQFDKSFSGWGEHYLIYGSELQFTESTSLREGATFVTETGVQVPEFTAFPARDFPESEARELSFFVQDEIRFLDGKLTVSPGVRYDEFTLSPREDALFAAANPGVETASFDDSEVSAKLGTLYKLTDGLTMWLQYAEGFRIPPFDDINVGFTNFAGGYTSLANPDLEPEQVKSYEVGLRGVNAEVDWSVSYYHNDYDNFIESLSMVGFNPSTGLVEFQAKNLSEVTIEGIDARATWFLGERFDALEGVRINTAITWLTSKNEATGEELESILPPQAVLGIGYGMPEDPWSVEFVATAVERFDSQQQPLNEEVPRFFEAPGYVTFDLLGHVRLAEALNVNYGIFNITDKETWIGTEVRGRTENENLGILTAPGRNFTVSLNYQF